MLQEREKIKQTEKNKEVYNFQMTQGANSISENFVNYTVDFYCTPPSGGWATDNGDMIARGVPMLPFECTEEFMTDAKACKYGIIPGVYTQKDADDAEQARIDSKIMINECNICAECGDGTWDLCEEDECDTNWCTYYNGYFENTCTPRGDKCYVDGDGNPIVVSSGDGSTSSAPQGVTTSSGDVGKYE